MRIFLIHNVIYTFKYLLATNTVSCDFATEEEYDKYCYVYSHTYNNIIVDGTAFSNGANFIYSDVSAARNTFEKNIMYGSGGLALYHHCGKDNMGVNNIVHRNDQLKYIYGGCNKGAERDRLQEYDNFRNIYLIDNMDDFSFARPSDRYYDSSPNFHHNIYWSPVTGGDEQPKFPDKLNWQDWQLSGNDSESVWQDPLFEDPANHKYVLTEESPAWDLGIEQIDLDNIGVQVYGKYQNN